MADFKTQVEDLIGSVGDDALITQSLIDIGGEIIAALPDNKLLPSALTVAVSSSGLSISDRRILAVDKDDLPAKYIPANQKARYNDANSIYAASDTNPVYYIEAETIYVNGAAGSGATSGVLHYVPKLPTHNGTNLISNGSDAVANFPLEAEYLLVLGSAVRCLQRLMADKSSNLYNLVTSISGLEIPAAPNFTTPDISSTTIQNLGVPPIYNQDDVKALIDGNKQASSYDAHDLLSSEDLELLQGNLSIVQVEMQKSLNRFNEENVEYQGKLQEAIQQAQLSSREAEQEANLKLQKEQQEYASELQKFQSELSEYQAKVSKEVQEYSQNLGQYQADYQWKQGQYAQLKAEYTQGLQLLIGR